MIFESRLSHFLTMTVMLFSFFISTTIYADGFIKKEVYSFKDKNGNTVFTDRQPAKQQTYKTQTIEAANSTGDSRIVYSEQHMDAPKTYVKQDQTVRIIVERDSTSNKKYYKKKRSVKRCKSYKKKLAYYTDKMKEGYKSSEYKKLEYNRKKYRKLLFNNCETKTFND